MDVVNAWGKIISAMALCAVACDTPEINEVKITRLLGAQQLVQSVET